MARDALLREGPPHRYCDSSVPGCPLFHSDEVTHRAGGGSSERSASQGIGTWRSPSDRSVPFALCLSDAEGPVPAPSQASQPASQPAPEGGLLAQDFERL